MRLLLDEDSGARSLQCSLRLRCRGRSVLITKNGADFIEIASRPGTPEHPGVLVIHYGQDGSSLSVATVVRAVANIAQTYETTKAMFLDVNHHAW